MEKYLNIPSYYKDPKNEINSTNLNNVFQNQDILDYLRKIFKEDVDFFYCIRDELLLRGIDFNLKYQNNILHPKKYNINKIILVNDDKKRFLQSELHILGIKTLLNRFNVSSDIFFNLIPIDGLANYLDRDEALIESLLTKVGFKILSINDYKQYKDENEIIVNKNNIKISKVFFETDYVRFKEYCKENNKTYISELDENFINKFNDYPGVGTTKFNKVISKYNELVSTEVMFNKDNIKMVTPIEYFLSNPLRKILEKVDVDYRLFLDSIYSIDNEKFREYQNVNFESKRNEFKNILLKYEEVKLLEKLKSLKQNLMDLDAFKTFCNFTIEQFNEFTNDQIFDLNYKDSLLNFIISTTNREVLQKIFMILKSLDSLNVRFESIENKLSDRERKVLLMRTNYTLEEIGAEIGVTRERVRQIEAKAHRHINKHLEDIKIKKMFNMLYKKQYKVNIMDFMKAINLEMKYKEIFKIILSSSKSLSVKENLVINKKILNKVEAVQSAILQNNKILIDADEVYSMFLSQKIINLDNEDVEGFLREINYELQNDKFYKTTSPMTQKIQYLFKNHIYGSLTMNDAGIEYFINLLNKYFNEGSVTSNRALIARIRDTENVVLVDANTFKYIDLNEIDSTLIEFIEATLEKEFQNKDVVKIQPLFEENIDILKRYGVLSFYYLYSLIQYHFSYKYSIGKGNTMNIYKSENAKVENSKLLVNFIVSQKNRVYKKDILNYFKWPTYSLDQLLIKSEEFIVFECEDTGDYYVKLMSELDFNNEEIGSIKAFIEGHINNDYVFLSDILLELEFNDEFSELLVRNEITNLYNFSSFFKKLFPQFKGFSQVLFTVNSSLSTIEEIISVEFPELVNRKELEQYLKDKGYADSTISLMFTDLEKKNFFNYTQTQLINRSCLKINDEVLNSLSTYLEVNMENKIYTSVFNLLSYSSEILPVSKYKWEPILIAVISELVGYRVIHTTKDYRYDKWIIVKADSNIFNYQELIYFVLTNEYNGIFHEKSIADFLENNSLTHNKSQLPLEIRNGKYFNTNEVGMLEIKERNYVIDRFAAEL